MFNRSNKFPNSQVQYNPRNITNGAYSNNNISSQYVSTPSAPTQLDNNPYYIAPKDSFKVTTKKTKFIELIMIITPLIVGVVLFTSTFDIHNKDNQKSAQISEVIKALRLYYDNSSTIEIKRVYPVALSSNLNEIDYEYTLQRHITGLTTLDTHAYISANDFPKDPWGVYSRNFTDRSVRYNRLERLPLPVDQNSYYEGFLSCNFDISLEKYSRCYLYTSSSSGDSFSLAYYSEVKKGFIIHNEVRNNPQSITVSFQKL